MLTNHSRMVFTPMQHLIINPRLSLLGISSMPTTPSSRQLTSAPRRQISYRPKETRVSSSPERSKKPVGVHRNENLNSAENLKNSLNSYKAQIEADTKPKDTLSPFRFDSTYTLLKKFFIYKMMSSEIFINYSLMGMTFSYRLFGVKLTNTVIEKTAGSIFTGGVTLDDLSKDIKGLEERNIGGIGCYVVEGIRDPKDSVLDEFTDFTMKSI